MYPAEHNNLAKQIVENNGCLISEHSLRMAGLPGHFPRRNRIISGLCQAVVVVEAGEKSGALLTAHLAVEQNREVLAVPGLITSPASIGTNRLLKRGAAVVTSVTDILDAIGLTTANPYPTAAQTAVRPLPPLSEPARRLYEAITDKGTNVDQLGQQLKLNAADLAMTITELELEGLVRREGSSVSRANYF
jgi:DNA processing protein